MKSTEEITDLERFRERVLDHPDEEEALSGRDIENNNNASTGPIKVIVRQDGIGRTGAVVLAIVSGLAIGIAAYSQVSSMQSERETRMLEYYVMELDGKVMQAGIIKPDESWSAKKRKKESEQ